MLDRDDLDLYDERVMVEFTAHIRPTLKFESVDELLEAMGQDVTRCRELLAKIVPGRSRSGIARRLSRRAPCVAQP